MALLIIVTKEMFYVGAFSYREAPLVRWFRVVRISILIRFVLRDQGEKSNIL